MRTLRDPIHRNVVLEDWAVDLVDTREFQRLRRIRQLGMAHLVYPGANHTRFEHALGAYKLAQDAARCLGLCPDDARPLEAAALLHDVGHGPFSHLFEEIQPDPALRHEERTRDLILWSALADRLRAAGLEPRRVAHLVEGRGPYGRIISGDIDVDRMDYLVRDAHYTGLRVSADPERILAVMALHQGDFLVREEGVTAVEALLLARFLMYPAVYFHHTCRAGETMVVAAARALLDEGADLAHLRGLDDAGFFSALLDGPARARDLAERVQERRLFKRAFEGTHRLLDEQPALGRLLQNAGEARRLETELAESCRLEPGYVILDLPKPPLLREVDAGLLRRDGTVAPLKQSSTLVRTLLEAQLDHWRFWVFAPKESRETIARAFQRLMEPKSVKGVSGIGGGP